MNLSQKALLVFGDASFAGFVSKFLAAKDFEVHVAKSGAEALEEFAAQAPDVVVATQLLPGMDGVSLCQKLKEMSPIPVILVSGSSSPASVSDLRRNSQADDVLPANFPMEVLLATARRLTMAPGGPEIRAVEQQIRKAEPLELPPEPIPAAPDGVAKASTAPVTMDPAWIISRAFADNVTGKLRFVSGAVERTIYFSRGRPIVATSNVPEERIGQILIRQGRLTQQELATAMNQARKKQIRLAQVIVDMGVMTQREHDEELASQYAERILAMFSWRDASIEFEPTAPPQELVAIRLAPERLITEGLRRHYDLSRLESVVGDPMRVLTARPEMAGRLPFLQLTPIEAAALILVDGIRTIAQVIGMAPSRPDALRALYACLCLDLAY